MKLFFISLGSNIGDRKSYIARAVAEICMRAGRITALSSLYETAPDGFASDNEFLNAVLAVESELSPLEMLDTTCAIERALGCNTHRNADGTYCDRTIDIDLIACEDTVMQNERLILPHPRMHLRRFVLDPLCEIAPDWIHPVLRRSAQALREALL